jgi:4,5-dihydroxyphthalate decarboxylase
MIAYNPPRCYLEGAPNVARLFDDPRQAEQAYFRRTRIFPIMHLVGVRRELAQDVRLCLAVCDAFERAKRDAIAALGSYQALAVTLPWTQSERTRVQALMGEDYWPYGVPGNQAAIAALARYAHAQGVTARMISVDELFAPGTLAWDPRRRT